MRRRSYLIVGLVVIAIKATCSFIIGYMRNYTVDLVIFACFNFRKFLILGLFTKFRIREFKFFFSCAIIIINTITINITIT